MALIKPSVQKKGQKEQKNSKKESVQSKESSLVQQQHHPLDLEVDLDAKIRIKRLSTVEEIKEYIVELSNLTMQDLRVRNNNGTVWIHCNTMT